LKLTGHLQAGDNRLELRQSPAGELPIQITGAYWLPARSSVVTTAPAKPISCNQSPIRRATLAVNDRLKCAVTVKNHTGVGINMAIGGPRHSAGFDVDTAAFEAMQEQGRIAKFEVTAIRYPLSARIVRDHPLPVRVRFRAKYPLRSNATSALRILSTAESGPKQTGDPASRRSLRWDLLISDSKVADSVLPDAPVFCAFYKISPPFVSG